MNSIELLKSKLKAVSDSYPDFVNCIVEDCNRYSDKNPLLCEQVLTFLNDNPNATSSEICDFELDLIGVPYCDDNGKWFRWGIEITEEEAQRVANDEYSK